LESAEIAIAKNMDKDTKTFESIKHRVALQPYVL
jgi:hypothetical protein